MRQVDPVVFNMLSEDPGKVDYSMIGGLSEQIRELRESIELPLLNPELFQRVGINPPKVQLLGGTFGVRRLIACRVVLRSNVNMPLGPSAVMRSHRSAAGQDF